RATRSPAITCATHGARALATACERARIGSMRSRVSLTRRAFVIALALASVGAFVRLRRRGPLLLVEGHREAAEAVHREAALLTDLERHSAVGGALQL